MLGFLRICSLNTLCTPFLIEAVPLPCSNMSLLTLCERENEKTSLLNKVKIKGNWGPSWCAEGALTRKVRCAVFPSELLGGTVVAGGFVTSSSSAAFFTYD